MSERAKIRGMHPYHFRSGKWAELLTTAPDPEGRDCYVVRFPDGATDFWVVGDTDADYEFRSPAVSVDGLEEGRKEQDFGGNAVARRKSEKA